MPTWAEITAYLKAAGSAGLTALVAALAVNYSNLPISEPLKTIIALTAVALWNRIKPLL